MKKHKSTTAVDLVRGIDKGEDIIEGRKIRKDPYLQSVYILGLWKKESALLGRALFFKTKA